MNGGIAKFVYETGSRLFRLQ